MFDGGSAALGSAHGEITISTESAQRAIDQLQRGVGQFAKNVDSGFRAAAPAGLALTAVAAGITAAFGAGVGTFQAYGEALANVNSIAQLTTESLGQVSDQIL